MCIGLDQSQTDLQYSQFPPLGGKGHRLMFKNLDCLEDSLPTPQVSYFSVQDHLLFVVIKDGW